MRGTLLVGLLLIVPCVDVEVRGPVHCVSVCASPVADVDELGVVNYRRDCDRVCDAPRTLECWDADPQHGGKRQSGTTPRPKKSPPGQGG